MTDFLPVTTRIATLLTNKGYTMATAESCTGGWIAKSLTDLPGSSAWFDHGIVTYSNAAKKSLLGVPEALLQAHGAVSQAVVVAMVEGVMARSDVDIAVSVSGIAGPGGGSVEKPVGLVWFAWAGKNFVSAAASCVFVGDREQVRAQAVAYALAGVVARI